jgi:hypothetical protein
LRHLIFVFSGQWHISCVDAASKQLKMSRWDAVIFFASKDKACVVRPWNRTGRWVLCKADERSLGLLETEFSDEFLEQCRKKVQGGSELYKLLNERDITKYIKTN